MQRGYVGKNDTIMIRTVAFRYDANTLKLCGYAPTIKETEDRGRYDRWPKATNNIRVLLGAPESCLLDASSMFYFRSTWLLSSVNRPQLEPP